MTLYDYVYVDLAKVISLYSQLTGGVVELRESNREQTEAADNKRHYDFRVFKHDAGGTVHDKAGVKDVIKPHHALLTELEDELARNGYLIDLTDDQEAESFRDPTFREQLRNTLCLKVRGRSVIEDYERIKGIAGVFPQVAELINKSTESNLRQSAAFLELQRQVSELDDQIKQTKDRNERAARTQQLKGIKRTIEDVLSNAATVGGVDQWILDGLKTWIDAFLPGIVNCRVYPSIDRADEHVFGHLKRECFEDRDPQSFHFTYGSVPTEPLTLLGIVTSVPDLDSELFKPLSEFDRDPLTSEELFEKAIRGMFRGFDGLEQMIRTSRFPRVLVYPLTVYRSVQPNPSLQRTAEGGR
jgi:hypothetical protein